MKGITIAEEAKELEYLRSICFAKRANDEKWLYIDIYSGLTREYHPSELEPRGSMIKIKIPSLAPMIILKDRVHQVIQKNHIDADAFTWKQCDCGLETIVQLYKIKGRETIK